jgi:hypothetical protein
MGPDTWGPPFWEYIHVAAFHADAQRKSKASIAHILDGFQESIPCASCEDHFDEFRNEDKLDTTNNDFPVLRWTVRAHNNVNKRNNKPLFNEDAVVDHFKKTGYLLNSKHKQRQTTETYYYYACIVLVVLAVFLFGLCLLLFVRYARLKQLLLKQHRMKTPHKDKRNVE